MLIKPLISAQFLTTGPLLSEYFCGLANPADMPDNNLTHIPLPVQGSQITVCQITVYIHMVGVYVKMENMCSYKVKCTFSMEVLVAGLGLAALSFL